MNCHKGENYYPYSFFIVVPSFLDAPSWSIQDMIFRINEKSWKVSVGSQEQCKLFHLAIWKPSCYTTFFLPLLVNILPSVLADGNSDAKELEPLFFLCRQWCMFKLSSILHNLVQVQALLWTCSELWTEPEEKASVHLVHCHGSKFMSR